MSRTSLETQKLDLIDEVSYLKLKLVSMEENRTGTPPQGPTETENNKAEVRLVLDRLVIYFKILGSPVNVQQDGMLASHFLFL